MSELGGRIQVSSAVGEGTGFRVELPLSSSEVHAPEPTVPAVLRSGPRQVLLVDDEALVRAALRRGLTRHGIEVVEASSGDEGLAQFGEDIDAVILDLAMPGRPGLEVLQELKRRRPTVPVMVLTGRPEVVEEMELADAVVSKPTHVDALLRWLSELYEC